MDTTEVPRPSDDQDQRPQQRGCLVAGCTCKDLRIVSPRRARFRAYLANARGEIASRVIVPDPEWVLPLSA